MKKITKGILSPFEMYAFTKVTDDKDIEQYVGSITKEKTIEKAKRDFISEFKKLKYMGDGLRIKMDNGFHVEIFIDRDYSNGESKMSETYIQSLKTISGERIISSRIRKYKNPEFENNPKCEFCNKKVTKLVQSENAKGTKLMVCSHCKKTLETLREFVKEYEAKQK